MDLVVLNMCKMLSSGSVVNASECLTAVTFDYIFMNTP